MSLLSPDNLQITLAPTDISLRRYNRLSCRQKLAADYHFDSPRSLDAVLEFLAQMLVRPDWRGVCQCHVQLSNHWLRFGLVPWHDGLHPRERLALAQAVLAERYGADTGSWQLLLSTEAYGRPAVAAALPEQLLPRLQALVAQAGSRLASVRPLLMDAFATHRSTINGAHDAFICLEPGKLVLLTTTAQGWHSLLSRQLPYNEPRALEAVLLQCFAQLDTLPQQAVLVSTTNDWPIPESVAGVALQTLTLGKPASANLVEVMGAEPCSV